MVEFFYYLVIAPLYNLFQLIFSYIYGASHDIGLTLFLMSMVVSVMCLPLYLKADQLQEEERKIQQKLKDKVDLIKRNYRGDERYMLLQTYYRQQHYHPLMRLRSSVSLLLQIPFFTAAYTFFSHLTMLKGMSWGPIHNLATPDRLLNCFGISINVLPIAMTLVNLLAAFIYARKKGIKENISLILVSLVFLFLLYRSPSGLVLYWLYNNLFSLFKNIAQKFMNREKVIQYAFGLVLILMCFLEQIWGHSISTLLFVTVLLCLIKKDFVTKALSNFIPYRTSYILSMLTLFFLVGIYVPTNTVASSPLDFFENGVAPVSLLLKNVTVYMGLFCFWGMLLYYFLNKNGRKTLACLSIIAVGYALSGFLLIKMPHISISEMFTFETSKVDFYPSNLYRWLYYLVVICIPFITLFFLYFKKTSILNTMMIIVLMTPLVLSLKNFASIYNMVNLTQHIVPQTATREKYIHLSKKGKNVLIIFLDKFVGSMLPIAFEEDKNLNQQFTGFTYYPKTLSYYAHTVLGYPPILGGYEYTPLMMDSRPGLFETKFKEAMTVLPAIFSQNGWKSTIINPQDLGWQKYAKWGRIPPEQSKKLTSTDLYDKYGIDYVDLHQNVPRDMYYPMQIASSKAVQNNIFFYSLLPILSPTQRQFIYDNGYYHNKEPNRTLPSVLVSDYHELDSLDKITDFNSDKDSFVMLNNNLTHSSGLLSYPNYDLSPETNTLYKPKLQPNVSDWTLKQYHVCMASLKLVGKYLDFLRNNNLYDNTRIIIVSDHGSPIQYDGFNLPPFNLHNPVLMVKDFNEAKPFKVSNLFQTNAEVPLLATKDIIKNPVNVHTKKSLQKSKLMEGSNKNGILVEMSGSWNPAEFIGKEKVFFKGMYAYFKGNDPSKKENWMDQLSLEAAKKLMENQR